MAKMIVSIIIDNFNYGRYLRDAIDSALNQTYPNTEVIVVDDGSTDNSREIISTYSGHVTSVLKQNGGQASAFNAGYVASKGTIVLFLDADDLLFPQAAARLVEAYHTRYTKLQFRLRLCDKDAHPLPETTPRATLRMPNGNISREVLSRGTYPCPPTSGNAFSRWYLDRVLPMPEEDYRQGADGGFLTLLAPLYGEIHSLDEELGMYRVHGSNFFGLSSPLIKKEWFVERVLRDIRKEALLREQTDLLGYRMDMSMMLRNEAAQSMRLVSLRMDKNGHPVNGDTRINIVTKSLIATWRHDSENLRVKLRVTLWLPLLAWMPLPVARRLVSWRFVPGTRPAHVKKLINWFRGLNSRGYV